MQLLLSLDIGKKNIHMVEGSFVKGNITVEKAITIDLPEEAHQEETISNPDTIADHIKMAVQNYGFKAKDAVITYDAYDSVVRDIDLPPAKPKEIRGMIENEMIQSYHVSLEDIIQFKHIDKIRKENGSLLDRYRAAAIDMKTVESYYNLINGARLKAEAMDININAIGKLFYSSVTINDIKLDESSAMLMDFGGNLITIYVISKGKQVFFRQLDSGSSDIDTIISNQTFDSREDIRRMKEAGFNFFGEGKEASAYLDILRPFFYSLMDEIRKTMGFYSSRSKGEIEYLFLFGGGSRLSGFAEYCENNLGLKTEVIKNISKVKFNDPSTPLAPYINAIGALIRY